VLAAARRTGIPVAVADNGSSDDSLALLASEFRDVITIPLGKNHGFGRGYNQAVPQVPWDVVIFLNSDMAVEEDFADHLLASSRDDDTIFAASARVFFQDADRWREEIVRTSTARHRCRCSGWEAAPPLCRAASSSSWAGPRSSTAPSTQRCVRVRRVPDADEGQPRRVGRDPQERGKDGPLPRVPVHHCAARGSASGPPLRRRVRDGYAAVREKREEGRAGGGPAVRGLHKSAAAPRELVSQPQVCARRRRPTTTTSW